MPTAMAEVGRQPRSKLLAARSAYRRAGERKGVEARLQRLQEEAAKDVAARQQAQAAEKVAVVARLAAMAGPTRDPAAEKEAMVARLTAGEIISSMIDTAVGDPDSGAKRDAARAAERVAEAAAAAAAAAFDLPAEKEKAAQRVARLKEIWALQEEDKAREDAANGVAPVGKETMWQAAKRSARERQLLAAAKDRELLLEMAQAEEKRSKRAAKDAMVARMQEIEVEKAKEKLAVWRAEKEAAAEGRVAETKGKIAETKAVKATEEAAAGEAVKLSEAIEKGLPFHRGRTEGCGGGEQQLGRRAGSAHRKPSPQISEIRGAAAESTEVAEVGRGEPPPPKD